MSKYYYNFFHNDNNIYLNKFISKLNKFWLTNIGLIGKNQTHILQRHESKFPKISFQLPITSTPLPYL